MSPACPVDAPDAAAVEACLREGLPVQALAVRDDSHLHAGHAGAREGRHFHVRIVSPAFLGLPRLARHRLVYDRLSRWMPRGIHALALETLTPDEASR
ncbi:BolA family transcriptional regulator [Piscinibacter sp. SJAQ100]|uniref:BolA family transcriptional regulator n=1 Tax=Aquariibacter albus TaxID=2759899 RepID=A0A839HKW7_9BURK|nr:BolA family transcriptional regulator [Aquariibacter albus]